MYYTCIGLATEKMTIIAGYHYIRLLSYIYLECQPYNLRVVLIILQSVNDNQYLTRKEVVRRCRGRRWLFMETNPKVVNLYSAGLKSLASCVKNKKCVYEYKAYVWGSRPLGGGRCSLVASAERLWLS